MLEPTRRVIEKNGPEVDILLPDEVARKSAEMRSKFASGALKAVSSHIVMA